MRHAAGVQQFVYYFNVSHIASTDRILAAELRLFKLRPASQVRRAIRRQAAVPRSRLLADVSSLLYVCCYDMICWWLGGSVVRALDSGPRGREFNSRPVRYQVTTLGKLFTPTCLCRCAWSSGWCRLVTFRLYPVYTMKLARRAGSTSARRALVVRSSARRAGLMSWLSGHLNGVILQTFTKLLDERSSCARRASSSSQLHRVNGVLRFDSHCGLFASNLEQVANLLCAQVNLASYPQRDGK